MDTGSELTWLQCEDCQKPRNQCFGEPPLFFTNTKSSSYRQIPCNSHELCYKKECEDGFCSYLRHYGDGSFARGILAFERFTFGTGPRSNDISRDVVFNMVFGCNVAYLGESFGQSPELDYINIGIIGLGWGPRSIIRQLETQIHPSFSYCFPHYDKSALGTQGYFKLGSEGDLGEGFSSIRLRKFRGLLHYYLDLEGISVNRQRLTINVDVFIRKNNRGGTVIDSGSTFTYVAPKAYDELKKALMAFFQALGNYEIIKPGKDEFQLDLCYKSLRHAEEELPSITFHFSGADLVLKPENVFIWLDNPPNAFCLAMQRNNEKRTILGAYQQSNCRFVYDRSKKVLLFKPEDCHGEDA